MKAKLFSALILASLFSTSIFSQNLLVDSDFESYKGQGVKHVTLSNKDTDSGKWLMFLGKDQTGFSVTVENDKDHEAVLRLNTTTQSSWYKHYLMQRLPSTPSHGIYRLSFFAKGDKKSTVLANQIMVIGDDNQKFYILKKGFNDHNSKHSGATYEVRLSTQWQKYEFEFDFSKMCNNINSPYSLGEKYIMEDTTEEYLRNCRVTIQSFKTRPSDVYIDNVKLEKVK